LATDGLMLLRMLEPPVRPDGISGGAAQPLPIEARGFEAILAEARDTAEDGATPPEAAEALRFDPLRKLSQLDRVENGDVRQWMAGRSTVAVKAVTVQDRQESGQI